jgi:ubiquinone/menaquinone biosynthesis C-methylase UbiE
VSGLPDSAEAMRGRTQAHYDKYPFRFDQRWILEEKMSRRLMGSAIREVQSPEATVLDVGCGACRVAHMVRAAGRGRVISIDISLATLRAAATHNPDPVVNGDNMRLPIRGNVADLVVSNGVIMVTPDARASFNELARVTKPGGTLVVSVYNRRSWYYPVYRYGGRIIRGVQALIGDRGLRVTIFPLFHLCTLILIALVMRKLSWIPVETSWNLFHDQLTTPHCTFHTFEELSRWAAEAGLVCEAKKKEAANQLITFKLRKPIRD